MFENKTINRISMRAHLANALAWAGALLAISYTIPEFKTQTASILIVGFMLEMLMLIVAFKQLRTHNNK
jgi:putative copper export protein